MNTSSIEKNKQNENISVEQVGIMFDNLFLDPEKKDLVAQLFKGFTWQVREQKVQEAIQTAKGWLQDLKNTIS